MKKTTLATIITALFFSMTSVADENQSEHKALAHQVVDNYFILAAIDAKIANLITKLNAENQPEATDLIETSSQALEYSATSLESITSYETLQQSVLSLPTKVSAIKFRMLTLSRKNLMTLSQHPELMAIIREINDTLDTLIPSGN